MLGFFKDILDVLSESQKFDTNQKVSLLIKVVVGVFLFQIISVICQAVYQFQLKRLEKRVAIDKIKAENKIKIYEKFYSIANEIHKFLPGYHDEQIDNVRKITELREYLDENKLYLGKKTIIRCNVIIDLLIAKVTAGNYDEQQYIRAINEFKKDFDGV